MVNDRDVLACDICGSSCADDIGLTMIAWDRNEDNKPSARVTLAHKACYPHNSFPWTEVYVLADPAYVESLVERRVLSGLAMRRVSAIGEAVRSLQRSPEKEDLARRIRLADVERESFADDEDEPHADDS
ncbi:MAG TPA: hypothetical protein VGJ91_20070 [Polyangiaceae bacterium]|jgi:hypothetical protein